MEEFRRKFIEAVGNDLNTSSGLTVLHDVLKADISDATKLALVKDFERVLSLGLLREEEQHDEELVSFVEQKIAERKAAKKEKDFAKADAIREELLQKGIVLKDTREGTVWEKA